MEMVEDSDPPSQKHCAPYMLKLLKDNNIISVISDSVFLLIENKIKCHK
jgi:hypothetical protein